MKKMKKELPYEEAEEIVDEFSDIYILYGVYKTNYRKHYEDLKKLDLDFIFYTAIKKIKTYEKYNKIKFIDKQLFHGYAFLLTKKEKNVNSKFLLKNIKTRILKIDDKVCKVPKDSFLKCIKKVNNKDYSWEDKITKGEIVRCQKGPFKNFSGCAVSDQKGNKVKVEIDGLFNRKITCKMNVKNLVKV